MQFNITAIKQALKEAEHVVSEGEHLIAKDINELVIYATRRFALTKSQVLYGLAYPSLLPKDFPGHPDAEPVETPAPIAAQSAPAEAPQPVQEPVEAPQAQEQPVEAAPEQQAIAPQSAPEETPAPEVKEEADAPEQTEEVKPEGDAADEHQADDTAHDEATH